MIDELLKDSDKKFDIQQLFNKSIDTFKIKKYNNNHDEILNALGKVFELQ